MPLKVQGQPYPFASHLQSDDLEIVPFELPPAALSNFAPGTSTPDLLAAIGGYLAAATAELSRLEDLSSTISKLGLDIDRGSDNPTTKMELECVISLAFHDIHFTAIVLDKVRQALRGLLPILADLAETASDPSICRSYHKHLQHMLCGYLDPVRRVRNYLEHIDSEVMRHNYGPFAARPGSEGIVFSFGPVPIKTEVTLPTKLILWRLHQALGDYLLSLPSQVRDLDYPSRTRMVCKTSRRD